ASINEFLTGPEACEKHPECWVDETRWHARIARHYRSTAANWADVPWLQVDRYGLAHLAAHVLNAGPRMSAEAADMVCAGLRRAVGIEFGTQRRFLELVDGIAHHVSRTAPVATGLRAVMYLAVVRHQAAQSSGALTPRVIGLLARTGRVKQALEHAVGLQPSLWQFTAFAEILRYASHAPGDPSSDVPATDDLLDLLVESALSIPRSGTGDQRDQDARGANEQAARLLAPYDLERALRLWQHEQEMASRGSRPGKRPDAVYRAAAAAEQDVDQAHALIDRISGERWADYLDLAERAGPERAAELLRAAESALKGVQPATRVLALARLAAAWAPHAPDTGRRLIAEVRAEVFEAGGEDNFTRQLITAADVLGDVDRTTARFLLARLDTAVFKGASGRAIPDAVRLWTRWDRPERAETLADHYLASDPDNGMKLAVLKALGQSSPAEEQRFVERMHAALPKPPGDPTAFAWRSSIRDIRLANVVRTMAEYDLDRAAQLARGMHGTNWTDDWRDWHPTTGTSPDPAREIFGNDRYSILAGIAHVCLTRGRTAQADAILEELLRHGEEPAPLRGGGGVGAFFVSSLPASGEPPVRSDVDAVNPLGFTAVFNLSHDWAARVRTHFFRDPADVVRAVELRATGSAARVVRRLAERLAHQDRSLAGAVVRSIADPGERAIGFAELHRAAHGPVSTHSHHSSEADEFSKETDSALGELPRHRWTVPDAAVVQREAWAYARPDHRVRFELAVRALGCRSQDMEEIEELPYLFFAQLCSLEVWGSEAYATDMIGEQPPHESFEPFHVDNLGLRPGVKWRDLAEIRAAACAYHEYRIA
ncbi:hypothetical protein AB0R12_37675, partial [Streptomyces niveus]|uniref:hypothetical protein n=1 Tax=Streptomyces niveus TaxID=193462 RepID=UPI003423F7FD